jgi:hypothetical protein
MAKLNREAKLREKRVEKQARKAARRLSAASDEAVAASGPEERGTGAGVLDAGGPGGSEAEPVAADSEPQRPGM